MKQLWQQYTEKFNAREMRERVILSLCVFAVIYGFFYYSFFLGLEQKEAAANSRIELMGKEVGKLTAQEQVFAAAIANDPNAEKKRELARLQQQLENLDENLMKLSVGLISAVQLPKALRDVLNASGDLKLLGLETQPPAKLPLKEPPPVADANEKAQVKSSDEMEQAQQILESSNKTTQQPKAQENKIGVYKHTVLLAIEGEYFDVITYLKSLENLPWKIYWQELNYEVTNYPKAEVLIEVYTLSTEEGFIGV